MKDKASLDIVPVESTADMAIFHETMRRIFPADEDCWSTAALIDRRDKQHGSALRIEYLVIRLDGQVAGIRWLCLDAERETAYCPYGGLLPEYQRRGLYLEVLSMHEQILAQNFQISIMLNDCQNPGKVKEPKEALDRLRFFQAKAGYQFISDENYPYIRPYPSPDPFRVSSYDYILGYKLIKQNHHTLGRITDSPTSLRLRFFRYLYMSLMRLDTGTADEAELQKQHPAVDEFLGRIQPGLVRFPEPEVTLLTFLG